MSGRGFYFSIINNNKKKTPLKMKQDCKWKYDNV